MNRTLVTLMNYFAPSTLNEAIAIKAKGIPNTFVMAGGTDLIVQMHGHIRKPDVIIDLKRIDSLTVIAQDKNGFRIGSAVPAAQLAQNRQLAAAWPGVVEAARLIGSDQIQNRCSIGGNLCNASPAADSVPPLLTAGAKAHIVSQSATRECAVKDLLKGPGETHLKDDEILASIWLPPQPPRAADAYLRFIPRTEMDIAVCSASVALSLDEKGHITAARAALGAVAPTAILLEEADDILCGGPLDEDKLQTLEKAAQHAARPIDDKRGTADFRRTVVGVMTKRAAQKAWERASARV